MKNSDERAPESYENIVGVVLRNTVTAITTATAGVNDAQRFYSRVRKLDKIDKTTK